MASKMRARARHELFADYLLTYTQRYRRDVIIVIIGEKGTAKSTIAYQLSKRNDPSFSLKRNEYYDIDSYLEFLDSAPPPGTYPIFDDLSTAGDAKKWWDDFNRAIARISQFGGSFRYVNFFIAPDIRQHLTDVRALATFVITTYSEPQDIGFYHVRKGKMSDNLTHPAIFYPYLRRSVTVGKESTMVTFNPCYVPKMSDVEYREYEEYKEMWTRGTVTKIRKDIKRKRIKKETGARDIDPERQIAYY